MDFLLHLLATISMTLFAVLGYNLIFGRTKILFFGQLALSLMASYGIFLTLRATGSYPLAIVVGAIAVSLLALLFAWLSLRLESDAFGVMSIAVHLITLNVILNWSSLTRGALGVPSIPRMSGLDTPLAFAIVTFFTAALWMLCLWMLDRGTIGRRLRALAEQPQQAQATGISRTQLHVIIFLLAGMGSLLTNIFYPQYIHLLHPSDFAFIFVPVFVMYVVAGKPGSVPGVILATVLLVLLREGMRFLPLPPSSLGALRHIFFGLILWLAVWFRRDTLFPKPRSV